MVLLFENEVIVVLEVVLIVELFVKAAELGLPYLFLIIFILQVRVEVDVLNVFANQILVVAFEMQLHFLFHFPLSRQVFYYFWIKLIFAFDFWLYVLANPFIVDSEGWKNIFV